MYVENNFENLKKILLEEGISFFFFIVVFIASFNTN